MLGAETLIVLFQLLNVLHHALQHITVGLCVCVSGGQAESGVEWWDCVCVCQGVKLRVGWSGVCVCVRGSS